MRILKPKRILVVCRRRGVVEVPPEWGYLMGGYRGRGRLAANETIVDTLRQVLGRNGELSRVKIVVTAGGTREPVDRVHFLGSYSTGKMGFAPCPGSQGPRGRCDADQYSHQPVGAGGCQAD